VDHTQQQPGLITLDPEEVHVGENHLMTNLPANFNGMVVNNFLGASKFYSAGITGQGTVSSNVEAGHIWSGHQTMGHVTTFNTGTGALGETDRHATWVGMMIGGRKVSSSAPDYQTGIAMGTDLRSGAIATVWNPASPTPRFSLSFNFNNGSLFGAYQTAFTTSDVINSSWGTSSTTGSGANIIGLDGLARANPRTTFVASAGNGGPGANTVGGIAAGYNSISVANLSNANSFDILNNSSSRGPQDYFDPVNGLIAGARVAVDIAAPGTSLTSAYYGGETGGNSPVLGGSPNGNIGGPNFYSFSVAGTSFAAPIVAGAAALLDSASYNTPGLAANLNSRDARVIKSVLLNSATKTPGWNNGQQNLAGVITTHQALDYGVGAGRLNLDTAYDQYLAGTKDVAGNGGGAVDNIGWDFGMVAPAGTTDYLISDILQGGSVFNVTLSWFRDRSFVNCCAVSDNAYRDLDLEVWNGTFTNLIATSDSPYENVEHLSFLLPQSGSYGLRVRYAGTVFGAAANENYGLSWAGAVLVPEPEVLAWLMLAGLLGQRRGMKISM
jgi:subtilisin family serine protease